MATLLLARHGEKESESGPVNWALRLTPGGLVDVASTAAALAARGLLPCRIVSSPFPRCVQTAALYAAALLPQRQLPPVIAIEPGLCEVLSPAYGGKGLTTARPEWTHAELQTIAEQAAPGVALDAEYAPIVAAHELQLERSDGCRREVEARVQRLGAALAAAAAAAAGGSGGGSGSGDGGLTLWVTHGSPCRRLVDVLDPAHAPCEEPAMGSVLHLVGGQVVARVGPAPRRAPAPR
jgi:broad specificity phosphatase PhoE